MTQDQRIEDELSVVQQPERANKIPVSVIIMTKNEARAIARTVDSVRDFVEVFVVDSNSGDDTQAIARAHGATVVTFTWNGQYPKKKQWCLEELPFTQDWVLYLDADEIVTPELAAEIRHVTGRSSPAAAYDVKLNYVFLGRRLRHGHKVSKRILARRASLVWPQVNDLGAINMWEVEGHYQPSVLGSTGKLHACLIHDDPDPLYTYFDRHNRYSDWEAHMAPVSRESAGAHEATRNARLRRIVPLKPLAFPVYSYFLRGGFLDGRAGLHYALANSFYYWQVAVKRLANRTQR